MRSVFLLVLWFGLLTTAGGPASPTLGRLAMCTLVHSPNLKRRGEPYFLGIPLRDTVPAGPGATSWSRSRDGHFGRPTDHPVYGQFVKVSKTGGSELPPDAKALDTVVVVAWDYDPGCEPLPWARSSAWLPEDSLLFFTVSPRDRAHWYRNYPTFDAFAPENAVYPSAYASPVFGAERPALTPEQLFEFYEAMPAVEDMGNDQALAPARAWSDRHRDVLDVYPMQWLVREVVLAASQQRARRMSPPMRGTYRLRLTLPDRSYRVFYARTVDRPSEPFLQVRDGEQRASGSPWDDPSVGFELWFFIATAVDSLPTKWVLDLSQDVFQQSVFRMRAEWPWHIAWAPDTTRSGTQWPASIEPFQFMPLQLRDPMMDSLFHRHEEWFDTHWHSGTLPRWFGWFTMGPGGSVHFKEPIPMGTAGILLVEGERISTITVVDSLPWH